MSLCLLIVKILINVLQKLLVLFTKHGFILDQTLLLLDITVHTYSLFINYFTFNVILSYLPTFM